MGGSCYEKIAEKNGGEKGKSPKIGGDWKRESLPTLASNDPLCMTIEELAGAGQSSIIDLHISADLGWSI